MRMSRLPAGLVAAVLMAGIASCSTTVAGSGTIASDVVTGGPTPTADDPSGSPTPDPTTASPTPDPTTASPTPDPVKTRELALCVLERAAIANVNTRFNAAKDRGGQIKILRDGTTTIRGHLGRSGLPATDGIRRSGQAVLDQLNRLAAAAAAGSSPSTSPYNKATQQFQKACNTIS